MYKQIEINKVVIRDLKRLEDTRNKILKEIKDLPKGSITQRKTKFYISFWENGQQHMVSAKDEKQLKQIIKRKHFQQALPVLERRIASYKKFLEDDIVYDPMLIIEKLPDQYKGNYFPEMWLEGDVDPSVWANQSYEMNSMPIANPNTTAGGVIVRSKSEAIIGTRLEENCLIFKNEMKIVIGNEIFCPDFTILLPKSRRIVYWEHFGLMDQEDYMANALHKIEAYCKSGLHLGYDFFFTYETREKPLTYAQVDAKIIEILMVDEEFV